MASRALGLALRQRPRRVSDVSVPHTGSKFNKVETLIVGGGPAGTKAAELVNDLPLRRSRRSADLKVVCVGGGGIWPGMARSNPSLLMGQSGMVLETDPRLMTAAHAQPFMPAAKFVEAEIQKQIKLREMGRLFVDDEVLRIRKYSNNEFLITTQNQDRFIAQRIVQASGVGPQINAASLGLTRRRPGKPRRPFAEDTDALSFLMGGESAKGGTVVVLGGGPSAAWAAGEAARHHNEVIWVASKEHGGFLGANPSGRNTGILQAMRGRMFYGSPAEVIYRPIQDPSDARYGGVVVCLNGFQSAEDSGSGKEVELLASQVVVSYGSDSAHTFSMVDPLLFNDLGAIGDEAGAFSSSPLDVATGLMSSDNDMMVVGAAAARGLARKGSGLAWGNIALTLPPAARPYEGIAMGNASIEAIANVYSMGGMNYLTANRQQIAEDLKRISRAGEGRRLAVADQIVASRAKLETAEYQTWDIASIIRDGL